MKKILSISLILSLFVANLFADDYYWVGDGGDWTDYTTHWATSSGGSNMHTTIPGINDNVYFDENSFVNDSQVCAIDTSFIECALMDWTGVINLPEFISTSSDTLIFGSTLILPGKANLNFNISGLIIFRPLLAGQTLIFDPVDHEINANVLIDIDNGNLNVISDLQLPKKDLRLINGTLNLSSNNLKIRHFNAQSNTQLPVSVTDAAITGIDTVFCRGSLHFTDQLDIAAFNGAIKFISQLVDTNYVNFENHTLTSEIIFNSGKKYFAISDINTDKDILLQFSGKFYSQNHNITCHSFESTEPMVRTIDLGTSDLTVSEISLQSIGLTFMSATANLIFSGTEDLVFNTNKSDLQFVDVSVVSAQKVLWDGKIACANFNLAPGVKMLMESETEINFANLNAIGNCGQYIELRALCDEELLLTGTCVNVLPVFNASSPVSAQYLKISNVKATGSVFTASNSFDEGGNVNFTITEPASVSTLYWIGNTGKWNDTGNWSASSGGVPDACIPSKNTHVVFDNSSFSANDTVKLFDYAYCASMTWTGLSGNIVFDGDGNLFVTDSIVLNNNLSADFNGNIYLESSAPYDTLTITSNGSEFNAKVFVEGTQLWNFVDAVVINNDLNFINGRLKFSGGLADIDNFISTNSNVRTIDLTNTVLKLKGTNVVWDVSDSNLTTTFANS
ncbi:MAG: hypothetical protein PHW82_01115, partial [Bacteroidales bacterium]|nr:hypothetical protein [Bacteroidales bacterium]